MIFQVSLVDPFSGGIIQVSAFLKQAMDACDYPNTEQPFTCLDLTFIYILLRDGFGLDPTTKLYVRIQLKIQLLYRRYKSLNIFIRYFLRIDSRESK